MASTRVALLGTGGTIASTFSADGELLARRPVAQLLDECEFPEGILVEPVTELSRVNSWDMDPPRMWQLAAQVNEIVADPAVAGIVVTHGTDTLEETAFAVDLACASDKPIIFASAMRSADSTSSDGPRNLSNAIAGAASGSLRGLGVLVSTSDQLHSARWIRKVHTHHTDAFSSTTFGPIASFGPDRRLRLLHRSIARWTPSWPIEPDIPVMALTPYCGIDPSLVWNIVDQTQARGLILEGFGLGNLPGALTDVVAGLTASGVVVVVTSRVLGGGAYPVYGGAGGGSNLAKAGAVFAGELSTAKVRLLLMCCLADASAATGRARLVNAVQILDREPRLDHDSASGMKPSASSRS